MERLWAPWRIAYIENVNKEGCIFCDKPKERHDKKNLIIMRGKHVFVMLNAYPYTNGHLMVAPYRHVADVSELSDDEGLDVLRYTRASIALLKRALSPEGFNIGINMGKIAGAGIAEHIHMHIVPRWNGDTNFMPVLVDTRIIPEYLESTYARLFDKLDVEERSRLY
jgi:ATP adenylyltransferase